MLKHNLHLLYQVVCGWLFLVNPHLDNRRTMVSCVFSSLQDTPQTILA
jgi:hypothetical protein